jgi:zinc protease
MTPLTQTEAPSRAARVQIVTSPGGIEAWLVEDYAVPLVAVEFAMRGGTSQDPPGKAGAARLFAGCLDEGAGPYDSDAFQRALEDKAIELSFSADRDAFQGRLKTLTRHADAAFDLLRLAVSEARLDAEPFERIRAQLAASVRQELQDPDSLAGKAWREAAFPGHPYSAPSRGSLDTLPLIVRDDLVALSRRCLARDTLKVAVVGAINAGRVAKMLDDVFGTLPENGDRRPVADTTIAALGSRHIVDLDVPQATIRFGRPGIARKDADHMTAVVVNHILGGGSFTARLFKEVREKRGLAYSVHSGLASLDHTAYLTGGTSTKNERALESLDLIASEIRGLAETGPSEEELDKAKKYLIGSYALRFDSSTKIAAQLVDMQNEGLSVAWLDERNKMIAAVTHAEAARVAKRLLGDGELLVAIVGRPAGA